MLIKKKKIAPKTELGSSSHGIDSAPAVDNGDSAVPEEMCTEFLLDAKKLCSTLSVAGEDLKLDVCQLDQTSESTSTVRYGFAFALLAN